MQGQGQTALVPETLDFLFLTSVVESSKGQGGKTVDELKDITIPVRIGGHWQAPSYRLDVKELLSNNKLLEEKARKEAERGLKKLLGDKADNEGVKGWPTSCSRLVQIAPAFRVIAMQSPPRAGSVHCGPLASKESKRDAAGVGSAREGCLGRTKMVSLWFYQGADE